MDAHPDVGYWDHAYFVDDGMTNLETKIHDVLFPNLEIQWPAFATKQGLDPKSRVVLGTPTLHNALMRTLW